MPADFRRELLRARHQHVLRCSDAPDMSGANEAAVMQANLSKEQLDWVKQIYDETAPDRAAAQQRAQEVSDAQLHSQQLQDQITQDAADHYKTTFQPIEQKIATDATNYDTPERREQAAGQAMSDVDSAWAQQKVAALRDLAAQGVGDPSGGNVGAIMARMGVMAGAQQAAAANTARNQVETVGSAKLADAANLGRNIASDQATTASLALNAGNSSVGNQNQAMTAGTAGVGMMQQGYAGAQAGLAGAGQTYLGIAKTQAGDGGAGAAAGIGSAIGGIAMAI